MEISPVHEVKRVAPKSVTVKGGWIQKQLAGLPGQVKGLTGKRDVRVHWINMSGRSKSFCPKT